MSIPDRNLLAVAGVATAYVLSAQLGLQLAAYANNVTLVWPPSGIALAALLLGGLRLVPAIAIGAFSATALTGAPVLFAISTGIGNTLEACLGYFLLRHILSDLPRLSSLRQVLHFAVRGAVLSPIPGCLIGAASLLFNSMIPGSEFIRAMFVWWFGDAMGILIIAPLLLTLPYQRLRRPTPERMLEFGSLLASVLFLGIVTYGNGVSENLEGPLSYAVFPLIAWAALRFGQPGVATVLFFAAVFAALGTHFGHGPFSDSSQQLGLANLHFYLAVVGMSGLILAAIFNELKGTQAELSVIANRLQLAVRSANIGLWDWDLHTNCVTYSAEWKAQLGYEPWELRDHFEEWHMRCHPDDVAPTLQVVENYLKGRIPAYRVEFRMRHKDGSWKWILAYGQLVADSMGKPCRLIGCHLDISEQKNNEESMRQSEARFRGYFELGLIGMAITSPQKGWLEFNDKLCEILGYPRETLRTLTWAELTHPEDLDSDVAQFDRVVRGEIESYSIEKRFIRGDGEVIHADIAAHAVRGGDGSIDHFVALIHDLSERRRLEEQLRQSQKMEAVGQLAGGAAHDFNNYLTVISGYCELLRFTMPENDPSRATLETMLTASERAAELTRQLLAFSRQSVLKPVVLNLNSVIQKAEPLLQGLVRENIQIVFMLSPDVANVVADPGQLTQVLVNLATNARDAMPEGGLVVIQTSNDGSQNSPSQVVLRVSDTGHGMSAETMNRIFEPFYTTKVIGKGTGLGLAVVYGIVTQNHGTISVQSQPNQGTTFEIRFPAVAAVAVEHAPRPEVSLTKRGAATVLLVEDEPAVRDLSRQILERHGYRVLSAANGHDALTVAAESPDISILVTDVMMPEMNGWQLAQKLLELRKGLKVLFVSGYSRDTSMPNRLDPQCMAWLQKPFSPARLADQVHSLLRSESAASVSPEPIRPTAPIVPSPHFNVLHNKSRQEHSGRRINAGEQHSPFAD